MYSSLEEVYGDGFMVPPSTSGVHPSYPPHPAYFEHVGPHMEVHHASCDKHLQHLAKCKSCQKRIRVKRQPWDWMHQHWIMIAMVVLIVLLALNLLINLAPLLVSVSTAASNAIPDSVRLR
jgi:hypothetical protein